MLCLGSALAAHACSGGASSDSPGPGDAAADAGWEATPDGSGWDATSDATGEADATVPGDAPMDAAGDSLTMLSLNLHCFIPTGSAYSDDQQRYEAIAQGIATRGVQVVTLQEACVTASRDAAKELEARLEQLTGKAWYSSWQLAHLAWQGTADEAQEGVALLTDRPQQELKIVRFAHQQGLTRVALSAKLSFADSSVRVMSVHLENQDATAREEQAREAGVAALADAYPSPAVIVAGDFNAKEGSPAHSALKEQGFVDASDPLSANRIDHVFVHRGAGLSAAEATLVFQGPEAVSDHPGVLVRWLPVTPLQVSLTRVRTSFSLGAGELLSIRGSVAPLSWDRGYTLRHDEAQGEWAFVTSELGGGFEYKLLKNDVTWQTGNNQVGSAGNDQVTSPSF